MRLLNNPNALRDTPARFTIVIGQVYTVALEYPTGKQFPSQKPGLPDSVMFSLTNGQRLWLPVEVARLIDGLNLQPKERFTIRNHGLRRGWEVNKIEPTAPEDVTPPFAADFEDEAPTPAAPAPPPARTCASNTACTTTPMTKLEGALKTAILAASNAERYGNEIGYHVRFDAEAIKAMAITVLINSEGGRR
jgi:hypothetical protein